jgi:hypothetical protein
LAISLDSKDIRMNFELIPDSIDLPDDYVGTKIKKTVLPYGA